MCGPLIWSLVGELVQRQLSVPAFGARVSKIDLTMLHACYIFIYLCVLHAYVSSVCVCVFKCIYIRRWFSVIHIGVGIVR